MSYKVYLEAILLVLLRGTESESTLRKLMPFGLKLIVELSMLNKRLYT
jgi:hypothetical protein